MTRGYRFFLKSIRTCHIYVTLLGLALILFFAVTGFILNHEDWFEFREWTITPAKATTPTRYLGAEPDKLAIVEYLRRDCGATGFLDSFESEDDGLKLTFKSPGRETEVAIERETGDTEITFKSKGLLGRLTELHRGQDSGPAWRLVIDGSCILLVIVALTGLCLWSTLRLRRRWGLTALALGLTVATAVYFVAVP